MFSMSVFDHMDFDCAGWSGDKLQSSVDGVLDLSGLFVAGDAGFGVVVLSPDFRYQENCIPALLERIEAMNPTVQRRLPELKAGR
jgi:hypothetical protein